MTITDIQQALKDAGFDPGPIDGCRGRKTIRAIKAFQKANNLVVDGLVGKNTRQLLTSASAENYAFAIPSTIPWLETGFQLIGTEEKPGTGSNEAILGWADNLEMSYFDDDDIPWCGLFTAHCIASQMPEESLPNNPLGARRWVNFGIPCEPRLGAVMVFWRGSPDGWKGHVGLYWAEDSEAYHILGGNQSNAVTITRISKQRLLAARWPETGLATDNLVRVAAVNGRLLSENEA